MTTARRRRFGAADGLLRGAANVIVAWIVTPSVVAVAWALALPARNDESTFLSEAFGWYGLLFYDLTVFVALAAGLGVAVRMWLTKGAPPHRRTVMIVVGGAAAAWFSYYYAVWWGFPDTVYDETTTVQRAIAVALGAAVTLCLDGYLFQIGAWSSLRPRARRSG